MRYGSSTAGVGWGHGLVAGMAADQATPGFAVGALIGRRPRAGVQGWQLTDPRGNRV